MNREPLETPAPETPTPPQAAGSGLPENVAGALAYILGPITGILFFILDRQRRFVRFHAVQCLGVCIVMATLSIALTILSTVLTFIPILGWLVGLLLSLGLGLGGFALWIWLMLQFPFTLLSPAVGRLQYAPPISLKALPPPATPSRWDPPAA